jgi:hypothetical protein
MSEAFKLTYNSSLNNVNDNNSMHIHAAPFADHGKGSDMDDKAV